MCGPSSPYDWIKVPLNDNKVFACCVISAKLIPLTFFSSNVNQYNNLEMVRKFFYDRNQNEQKIYLQQDGTKTCTREVPRQDGGQLLEQKMWPPTSQDLNPADFYLWGHVKTVCTTQFRKHWRIYWQK